MRQILAVNYAHFGVSKIKRYHFFSKQFVSMYVTMHVCKCTCTFVCMRIIWAKGVYQTHTLFFIIICTYHESQTMNVRAYIWICMHICGALMFIWAGHVCPIHGAYVSNIWILRHINGALFFQPGAYVTDSQWPRYSR